MKTIQLNPVFKQSYSLTEAYKTLRTNLLFCGKDIQVISVTSCIAGEGKSSLCIELAKNLAQAEKKVLLIDADLRKSVVVSLYTNEIGIDGLSEYLSGQKTLDDVCYSVGEEGFDMIFAGQYPPNPVDLLSSDAFKELLEYGRAHYDYVLLDTPPLGMVIDSAVTCALSDGALLVVSADRIGYRLAQEVKEQIEKSGCRVLGAVLDQIDMQRSSYRYYSDKRYYRGKYYSYRYSHDRYGMYAYGADHSSQKKKSGEKD